MPLYESVFIARPDISATQVESLTEGFKSLVGENGGEVTKTEYWGLKSLTYRIKKSRKGHYSLMNLDAPPAAVKEMERNMLLNEDVLRFMTIRVDELEEGPSVVMRSRGSRDDRGRGDRPRRDDRPPRRDAESGSNDRPRREEDSGGEDRKPAEAAAEGAAE